ncbi:MAG: hypothetical protein R6W79_04915 [Acidimicrobiia bacterium]
MRVDRRKPDRPVCPRSPPAIADDPQAGVVEARVPDNHGVDVAVWPDLEDYDG